MAASFSNLSDEELVSLVSGNGNVEAFTVLASRYLGVLSKLTYRICSAASLSLSYQEDMQQEAMLGLYKSALDFDPNRETSFRTFASVCISNRLKNYVRNHKSSRNVVNSNSVSLNSIREEADPTAGPAEILEGKETATAVLNQIHISLSDFERDVLALYLSGYKRKQISEILSISTKSFDNALQRIRKKLATIQ